MANSQGSSWGSGNAGGYAAVAQAAFSAFQSLQGIKDAKRQAQALLDSARRQREVSAANTARLVQGRVAELARLQEALQGVQFQARGFKSNIAVQQGITQNYSNSVDILQADIDRQADRAQERLYRNQEQLDIQRNQMIQAEADKLKYGTPQVNSEVDYSSSFSQALDFTLKGLQERDNPLRPAKVQNGFTLYQHSSKFNTNFNPSFNAAAGGGAIDLSKALGIG